MPLDEKKLARYNLGRQFYQDHLSAIGLYDKLPKPDEYSGFTDTAVIGFLDMLSDDIRTMQERSPASSWHRIIEFCPKGMQIASSGGLSFDLNSIASMDATESAPTGTLTINFKGGGSTTVTFHRNTDGGPPAVYQLKRNIEEAIKLINTTAVFVKPDMLDGELLYGPESITNAATYSKSYAPGMDEAQEAERLIKRKKDHEFRMEHDPQYVEGWNAALHHILEISEKWMYNTETEEPPSSAERIFWRQARKMIPGEMIAPLPAGFASL